MRKIWIFNHYATLMYKNKGGRHYWFATNLIKKGDEIKIFCANTFHNNLDIIDTKDKIYSEDKVENISFIFVKTRKALGNGINRIFNMLFFYFNIFKAVKSILRYNKKPDIIIASSVHPLTMVAGIKIAKKLGIPCICEVRDLWPEAIFSFTKLSEKNILGKILLIGEKWIYENADALIFTKEGDIDYIKEKKWDISQGGKVDINKIFYINNGVDIVNFDKQINENVLQDEDLESEKFKILYTGAIRPVNDVGKILNAALLLKEDNDIHILIYGDGSEKVKLEERIKLEKIKNVTIKGSVDKKFIPYILSKSSINILNYSQDNYNWSRGNSSNKLFEYMASGKPIISTVKMGYSIIDKYNCGIELENATPEELAKAILEIKNKTKNEYKKIGENSRNGALEFDFKILTSKLDTVIDKVLSKNI